MPQTGLDSLPQEQGATRRSTRAVVIPANDNVPGNVRQTGLGGSGRPLNATAPLEFGKNVLRVRRLVSLGLDAGRLGVRVSPAGRVLNAVDLLRLALEAADRIKRRGQPAPVDPQPTRGYMESLDWEFLGGGWFPPDMVPGYTKVEEYRKNISVYISNHPDKNLAGGLVLPNADWASVVAGDVVTQVQAYFNTDDAEWRYITSGDFLRKSTSGDPFAGGSEDIVYYRFSQWPSNPNVDRFAPSEGVERYEVVEEVPEQWVWDSSAQQQQVSPRRPPPPGTREKKFTNKSAIFRVALFKSLDAISENAEIVDAFYEAIPKAERRAYEKALGFRWIHRRNGKWVWAKPKNLRRKLLDNAGQYGIDGADWKARAISRHWAKIDTEAAFKNLINNQTQDFVYGQLYKRLPKNIGHATDQGFLAVEKGLKGLVYQ